MRVVLDTNVVLSGLLFDTETSVRLRQAWQGGQVSPIVCRTTILELVRALAYPKFRLSPEEEATLLADYLPFAEVAEDPPDAASVPPCRDAADRVFLALASVEQAQALVTGDQDLLALRGLCPFAILEPRELLERLAKQPS